MTFTLRRLSELGVQEVAFFSGHFADTQLEMIDRIAQDWNGAGHQPRVLALSVNRAPIPGFPPDHAGLFETTLLDGIAPGLSDLACLASDPNDRNRFDPASALWGIVGTDPRQIAPLDGPALAKAMVDWLVEILDGPGNAAQGQSLGHAPEHPVPR